MKFYEYRQSNPGGRYLSTMPKYLYIQAISPEIADGIAENSGVYFDGIDKGLDCECCNDRWKRATEYDVVDGKDFPTNLEDGRNVIIYATELTKVLA